MQENKNGFFCSSTEILILTDVPGLTCENPLIKHAGGKRGNKEAVSGGAFCHGGEFCPGYQPFDNEADPVAFVQDALELWNAIGAGPLERDLVGNTDDLHGPGVTCYFTVGDRHHVIEPQRLGCGKGRRSQFRSKRKSPPSWRWVYRQELRSRTGCVVAGGAASVSQQEVSFLPITSGDRRLNDFNGIKVLDSISCIF